LGTLESARIVRAHPENNSRVFRLKRGTFFLSEIAGHFFRTKMRDIFFGQQKSEIQFEKLEILFEKSETRDLAQNLENKIVGVK